MKLPEEIGAEIQRGRDAGETHQLGRAWAILPNGTAQIDTLTLNAMEAEDQARFGAGIFMTFTDETGEAMDIFLDENAKKQLLEQLERATHIVDLHRAISAENDRQRGAIELTARPGTESRRSETALRIPPRGRGRIVHARELIGR